MSVRRPIRWLPLALLALLAACTPPAPAPEADFGFALGDTVFATTPGSSVITSVAITPINGFTGTVAFALSDQGGGPADPGFELDPGSIVVSGASLVEQSIQRQLAIDIGAGVANGSYDLRITASSGALGSTADLTVTVADNLVPIVAVTSPSDGDTVTGSRKTTIEGTLSSLHPIVAVDLLGRADLVSLSFDQSSFSAVVELEDRHNIVTVAATDVRGSVGVSDALSVDYPFLDLVDFQEAEIVIGQPDFVSIGVQPVAADTVDTALGNPFVTEDGVLFIPDDKNNRVLIFNEVPTTNGASADLVLGQPDLVSNLEGLSATGLIGPASVHSDGTHLVVADNDNNRVLIWNQIPTSNQTPADVVVGQPDFTSNASTCSADSVGRPDTAVIAAGRLIVAARSHNRVLIWNEIPTSNGEPADLVLGQDSFTTCTPNDDDQNGIDDGAPSARTLQFPTGVWSDGVRLTVSDFNNDRVLIWTSLPNTNFAPADLVIGQPDFVTRLAGIGDRGMDGPRQAISNGNQLFVLDQFNHRVLVYDTFPTANGAAADHVLGQSSFVTGAENDDDQDGIADPAPSARTLFTPRGVELFDDLLFVLETDNDRVLVYRSP